MDIIRLKQNIVADLNNLIGENPTAEGQKIGVKIVLQFEDFITAQQECLSCGKIEEGKLYRELLCSQCRKKYSHSLISEL